MYTRKSSRRSIETENSEPKDFQHTNMEKPDLKRRKLAPEIKPKPNPKVSSLPSLEKDDKMDPVEKLLSFSHVNNDILSLMDETENTMAAAGAAPVNAAAYPNISYNFNKVIHDNMRQYYAKFRKSQMEIHNDHSSFSVLTRPPPQEDARTEAPARAKYQVPFFKNVNFNASPSFGHRIEDYIHYDDDEPLTTDSETETEEIAAPKGVDVNETPIPSLSGKMSFHYRQNDKLNLSLSGEVQDESSADVFKFLNKRSVLSGKASEMIGTSNFLVSDFFF